MHAKRAVALGVATVMISGGMLVVAPSASAGNSCPSSDPLPAGGVSGSVTASDPDWWRWNSSSTTRISMTATSGDPDMKITDVSCGTVICYPETGASPENCDLPPGTYNVGVLYWSGPGGVASYSLTTTPTVAVQCNDGVDNDSDGKTDYPADPGCSATSDTTEAPNPQCGDGIDNEGDGRIDYPTDPGCSSIRDTTENSEPQCNDNLDNDGDGKTDYPVDPGCSSTFDSTEAPNPACSDGVDNDGDGKVDYPTDPGCGSVRDTSEGVACATSSVCAGISAGEEILKVSVQVPTVGEGARHAVIGYVDLYRFVLPGGTQVDLPCTWLTADGSPAKLCPGTLIRPMYELTLVSAYEPTTEPGPELRVVGICKAELVLTVNGIGISSGQAYTIC